MGVGGDLDAVRARDQEVERLDVPVDHHSRPETLTSLAPDTGVKGQGSADLLPADM